MKKLRPILGVSLIVQSITFFVLCLVNLEKKKNLAKAFGFFSALGGIAGVSLLVVEYRNRKKAKLAEEDLYDEFYDEFDDFDEFDDYNVSEDDLLCSFEGAESEE